MFENNFVGSDASPSTMMLSTILATNFRRVVICAWVTIGALAMTQATAMADGVESGPGATSPPAPAPRITFAPATTNSVPAAVVPPGTKANTSETTSASPEATTTPTTGSSQTTIATQSTPATQSTASTTNQSSSESTPSSKVARQTPATLLTANRDYIAGKAALDSKNWTQAISWFSAVTRSNPGDANAWNLLGYATRKNGDTKRALRFYDRALRLNPKHLGALEYQGEAYVELKQIAKAKSNLAKLKAACGTCEQYVDLSQMIESA